MIAPKIAKLNENSHNTELIKGIVLSGVYPNVAKVHLHIKNSNSQKKKANNDGKLKYLLAKSGQKVSIHPVSVCFGMKLEEFVDKSLDSEGNTVTHIKGADEGGYWLAFFDVMKNGGVKSSSMMRDTSVVDGLSVLLFGGGNHETEEIDRNKVILKIDEGVQFMTDVVTANAIINARQTMMDVIRWKIVNKKERMKMFSQEQLDYIDQVNDKIIEQVINIIEKKDFNLYDNSDYYGNGMVPMPEAKGQEYMMLPGNNAYASTAGYGYTAVTPVYPVMGYGVPGYRNSVMEQGVVKNSPFDDESVYSITESNDSYSYYPASMYNSNSTFTSQTSLLKNNEVLDNWNNYDDTSSLQESQDTAVYHTNSPIPSQHSNSSSTANLSKANNNSQTTLSSYNNSNENVHKLDDHHTKTVESKESNTNTTNTNTTTNRDSNISSQDKSSYTKNEINNNNSSSSSSINNNNNKSNVKPYLTYIAPPLQQKYKNMNSFNDNSNPSSPVIHHSMKQQQDMNERNYSRQSSRSSVSSTSNANINVNTNNNINSHFSPLIHNNEDTIMTNQDSSSSAASSHRDENQQSFAKRRQSSDLERSYNSSGYESSSRSHQVNRDDFYNNSTYNSNSNNFYPSKKKHSSYIFGQNKNQNQYGNSGYSSYNNPNENPRNNGNAFSNQNFRNNRNRYSDSNLVEQYQNSPYYNNGNNGYNNSNNNNKKMGRYSYSSSNGYNNNPNNNNNNMSMGMNNNNMNNMNRSGGNYNSYRNSINMGSFNNSKYNSNNNNYGNNNYDSFNNKQNRRSFNNQAYNANNNNNNYYYNNSSNRNSNRYSQRYN